jgi:hypothetical protein
MYDWRPLHVWCLSPGHEPDCPHAQALTAGAAARSANAVRELTIFAELVKRGTGRIE